MNVIVTYIDKSYIENSIISLKSVYKHNKIDKLIILSNDLTEEDITNLKKLFKETFIELVIITTKHENKLLNKLETFKLQGYSRVILIDTDIICLHNFEELFNLKGLCMAKQPDGEFNSGLVVIDKEYLDIEIYNKLIKLSKETATINGDQTVLNIFFRNVIKEIPDKYNYYAGNSIIKDVVNIHFYGVNGKPWNEGYCKNKKYWK